MGSQGSRAPGAAFVAEAVAIAGARAVHHALAKPLEVVAAILVKVG